MTQGDQPSIASIMVNRVQSSVGIIIVHYSNPSATVKCLESFIRAAERVRNDLGTKANIVVVDNSRDFELPDSITQQCVRVVRPRSNSGYAGGIWLGTRQLPNVDYYVFSNDDILADENMLHELLRCYGALADVGAIQPVLLSNDGVVDSSGSVSNPIMYCFGYEDWALGHMFIRRTAAEALEVFGVEGVMTIERKTWHKVGGWDPDFFMFCEDTLISWKTRLAGLNNYVALKAIAHHHRGLSAKGRNIKKDPIYTSY